MRLLRTVVHSEVPQQPVLPDVDRRNPLGATIDHLTPIAAGGADEPENVATAHWKCNRERGTRPLSEQIARPAPGT